MSSRSALLTFVGVVLLGFACQAADVAYLTPDLKTDLFGGKVTVSTKERQQTATALAALARHQLPFKDAKDYQTASRTLGIALRLDPDNRAALVLSGQLEDGRPPASEANWAKDDSLKQVETLAAALRDSNARPDHVLAAYLYQLASQLVPNDEDTFQYQKLKKAGIQISWSWADSPDPNHNAATANRPVSPAGGAAGAIRATTVMKGLVVIREGDGLPHGKAIEIIAVEGANKIGSSFEAHMAQGVVADRTMSVSLDEAARLVKVRHPSARGTIDVSFEDKYSSKAGGSAGCAFTLLLLSALGDFEINPNVAVTGDITVDGKVRAIGEVPAKVHGAALDHISVAGIPTSSAAQIEDAIVLSGPSVLWEIQVFSMDSIDDAIALARKDPDPKLTQAIAQFDELKAAYATKPPEALKDAATAAKLSHVLELAPNHVSAKYLQQIAAGKKPTRLTLVATVEQAMGAMSPAFRPLGATSAAGMETARKNLAHVQDIGDPAVEPLYPALEAYAQTYERLSAINRDPNQIPETMKLHRELTDRLKGVRQALETIGSDRETIDKLLHP